MTRNLLALNDAKWGHYATRSGTGAELAALLQASPKNDDVYFHILHECCDLQTFAIYPAAYAAFPHLESIAFASNDPKEAQWPLSICAAICANFKTSHDKSEVPPELWDSNNALDAESPIASFLKSMLIDGGLVQRRRSRKSVATKQFPHE